MLLYKFLITFLIVIFITSCSKRKNQEEAEPNLNSSNFFTGASLNRAIIPIIDMFKISENFSVVGSEVDLAINLLKTEKEVVRLQIYKAAEKNSLIYTYKYQIPNTAKNKIRLENQKGSFKQDISFFEPSTNAKFDLQILWYKYFHGAIIYGEDFTISYLKGIDSPNHEITEKINYTGKSIAIVYINKNVSTNNKFNMQGSVSVRVMDSETLKFKFFGNRINNDDKQYNFYNFNSDANYTLSKGYFSSSSIVIEKRTREDELRAEDDNGVAIIKKRLVEIPYVDEKFRLGFDQIESSGLRGKLFGGGQQLGSIFNIKSSKMIINGVVGANKDKSKIEQ